MDHATATDSQATERYLLGELSAAEADAFEDHYFDCAECADDLRVGVQVMSGGRGLAREAPRETVAPVVPIAEHRARCSWVPAVAAAALMLAITAPVIVKQQRDASAPVFEVADRKVYLTGASRAESAEPVETIDGDRKTAISVDVPANAAYSRYEVRLLEPDGSVLARPFTPDPNGEPLLLTVRGLDAGSHELVIVGITPAGQQAEVTERKRFNVRR
jgi:hypothetical protein